MITYDDYRLIHMITDDGYAWFNIIAHYDYRLLQMNTDDHDIWSHMNITGDYFSCLQMITYE